MRIFSYALILFCILTACAAPAVSPTSTAIPIPTLPPEKLKGTWLGGFEKSVGSIESFTFNFDDAELTIQPQVITWPMEVTTHPDGGIQLTVTGKAGRNFEKITFTGQVSEGILTGDLTWDGETGPATFTLLAQVDSSLLEKYAGVYRFDSGRVVSVLLCPSYDDGNLQYFPPGLMYTDFTSEDSRGLYPLDSSTFGIGSARVLGYPLEKNEIQFTINDSGEVTGLQWMDVNDPAKIETASRILYSVEEVQFTSEDGEVMAGLLTSPDTTELHPAFMMLHGSEPGMKDGFGQQILAHYMVGQGIALLTYDKRGVGDSGGTYREYPDESNVNIIASDAVAGVEYLATRPEINSAQIGLMGGSQAGWVIPVAAAESDRVAFFVILSGPVLSLAQEDRYSSATNDGESAVVYDAEKLDQILREMKPGGVSPIPILAELTQPGLWLWGSVDKNVPVTVSAENLQALIDSGKSNFSYAILANGDHNLNESSHGYFTEIPYSPRVIYFSELTSWLEEKNITPKE